MKTEISCWCATSTDTLMGRGFINEHSKIRIRMMTRNIRPEIDEAFFEKKSADAWEY